MYAVGGMMILSTGGSLLAEVVEIESPLKESQGEKEVESEEVFVRDSKSRKICIGITTTYPIVAPPKNCYWHIRFIRGHRLENGLIAPLLC